MNIFEDARRQAAVRPTQEGSAPLIKRFTHVSDMNGPVTRIETRTHTLFGRQVEPGSPVIDRVERMAKEDTGVNVVIEQMDLQDKGTPERSIIVGADQVTYERAVLAQTHFDASEEPGKN